MCIFNIYDTVKSLINLALVNLRTCFHHLKPKSVDYEYLPLWFPPAVILKNTVADSKAHCRLPDYSPSLRHPEGAHSSCCSFKLKGASWSGFGHLIRMPPGCLPLHVQLGGEAEVRPRTHLRDNISHLEWESLRTLWIPCRACCQHDPTTDEQKKINGWMDSWNKYLTAFSDERHTKH